MQHTTWAHGNPNASYYTYKALGKDSKGLHNGEGVDLNISQDANSGSSVLCIEKAYARTVDGTSYVMKEDKNGKIEKAEKVKTGKTLPRSGSGRFYRA